MKMIKLIITVFMLFFSINIFAQTKQLLVTAHHPNDKNTIIRIWKTTDNNYIIRTSHSNKEDAFDQERLYQYQKKVEYDGFAKRVTFKTSSEAFYVIAYVNEQYAFVYGFYSDALKDVVSIYYEIDYINKNLFKNL